MLRHVGCTLPIEFWHLGPAEMDGEMRGLVEPYEVTCVDAYAVRKRRPARILNGWELKPYSIIHSRFAEVLLLDADNVALVDPSFLFDSLGYRTEGAIFWPDYGSLEESREIWTLTGVPFQHEPEFESGQIVVDKPRCWEPLALTMWMNEHSDYWYQHVHGDKDTFHLAWRKLDRGYAMPGKAVESLDGVMCQHDFDGRRIFQHRNSHKFAFGGPNRKIDGFIAEDLCLSFLADLESSWRSRWGRRADSAGDDDVRDAARELCERRWRYVRVGHDERPLAFMIDGQIGEGRAACEESWRLSVEGETHVLHLVGRDGVTCELRRLDGSHWCGQWLIHEKMPVEIFAVP
jgi:hypothetical protein